MAQVPPLCVGPMLYTRFVEPGRLCLIEYGPYRGKTAVITDLINENRVVLDGHYNEVPRQQMPVRWLGLTDISCAIERGARQKTLKKAMGEADVLGQWEKSYAAKQLKVKAHRANMTDFDRFKLMLAKKDKSKAIKKALKK